MLHEQLRERTALQSRRLRLKEEGKLVLTPAFILTIFLLMVIAVTGSIFL